jgi:pyruvate/2-oxoglutarate dehydrogenase complex dihydrolipoamide dehydrogenase (E3) component
MRSFRVWISLAVHPFGNVHKVGAFLGDDRVGQVRLISGKEIKADIVIVGIGAATNTELAKKVGLEIGLTKGVQVNRYMQTNDENIFACGDCAEKVSFFDGKPSGLKLVSIATMEARVAGSNLFVTRRINMGVIGVYSTVLGNTAFAAAGLTESQAREKRYSTGVGVSQSLLIAILA